LLISITLLLAIKGISLIPIINEFAEAIYDFNLSDQAISKIKDQVYDKADTNIILINSRNLDYESFVGIIDKIKPHSRVVGVLKSEDTSTFNSVYDNYKNDAKIVFGDEAGDSKYFSSKLSDEANHKTVRKFEALSAGKNSFAVELLKRAFPSRFQTLLQRKHKSEIINYIGSANRFINYSADDIIQDDSLDLSVFNNKIVIVGAYYGDDEFKNLKSLYFTPLNDNPSGRAFPDMSAAEISANICSMCVNQNYIEKLNFWISLLIAAIISIANSLLFYSLIKKNEKIYEIVSLFIFLLESIILLALSLFLRLNYQIEANLTIVVLFLAVSLFAFELYNESIKPIRELYKNK
jgi:hypothetical protein